MEGKLNATSTSVCGYSAYRRRILRVLWQTDARNQERTRASSIRQQRPTTSRSAFPIQRLSISNLRRQHVAFLPKLRNQTQRRGHQNANRAYGLLWFCSCLPRNRDRIHLLEMRLQRRMLRCRRKYVKTVENQLYLIQTSA